MIEGAARIAGVVGEGFLGVAFDLSQQRSAHQGEQPAQRHVAQARLVFAPVGVALPVVAVLDVPMRADVPQQVFALADLLRAQAGDEGALTLGLLAVFAPLAQALDSDEGAGVREPDALGGDFGDA